MCVCIAAKILKITPEEFRKLYFRSIFQLFILLNISVKTGCFICLWFNQVRQIKILFFNISFRPSTDVFINRTFHVEKIFGFKIINILGLITFGEIELNRLGRLFSGT